MENINLDNLVTKDDLKNDLKETKDELKGDISKVFHTLDFKIDKFKDDLETKMQKNHEEVLGTLDKQDIILEKLDTELAGHQASYERHKETLDDHEKRINVLELKPAI